jgi:hypothetical protein
MHAVQSRAASGVCRLRDRRLEATHGEIGDHEKLPIISIQLKRSLLEPGFARDQIRKNPYDVRQISESRRRAIHARAGNAI